MSDFFRSIGPLLLLIAVMAVFIGTLLLVSNWDTQIRDKHRATGAAFAERCVAQSNMAVCVDACRTMTDHQKEGCEAQILLEVEKGAKP